MTTPKRELTEAFLNELLKDKDITHEGLDKLLPYATKRVKQWTPKVIDILVKQLKETGCFTDTDIRNISMEVISSLNVTVSDDAYRKGKQKILEKVGENIRFKKEGKRGNLTYTTDDYDRFGFVRDDPLGKVRQISEVMEIAKCTKEEVIAELVNVTHIRLPGDKIRKNWKVKA